MRFDSDAFLEQVKLLGAPPEGRFEDDEIFEIASNQINSKLVPLIISLKEEYYLTLEDQAITAGIASYPIPYRAMGLSLRDIKILNSSTLDPLIRLDLKSVVSTGSGSPTSFYLQGQDVVLYPTPQSTQGSLRLYYFLSPSSIVSTGSCGRITAVDRVTGIITAVTPAAWTTADTYDLVSSKNGHQTKAFDLVASNVTLSTSITFTPGEIPATIGIGDFICLSGEAPYLQAPDVCFQFLIQLTLIELFKSMGDQASAQAAAADLKELKDLIVANLKNRVQGSPMRVRITL